MEESTTAKNPLNISVEPKQAVHDLRKSIDAVIQWTKAMKEARTVSSGIYGREIALVYTKLQEAKMWAGKCLEAIGSELPEEYRDEAK